MSIGRVHAGLLAFLIVSGGVAANMMRQPAEHGKRPRDRIAALVVPDAQPFAPDAVREVKAAVSRDGRPADAQTEPETVRAIQRELQTRGYEPGTADGLPGLMTRAAILAFEHDHKLPLTAEPSDDLLRAILLGGATTLPQASSGDAARRVKVEQKVEQVVRSVQHSLASLGYFTRKPDGLLSEDVSRAIREFEMDQNMPTTGRISGLLVGRLTKAAANGRRVSGR